MGEKKFDDLRSYNVTGGAGLRGLRLGAGAGEGVGDSKKKGMSPDGLI